MGWANPTVVPAEAGTSPLAPRPQPRRSRGGGNLTFYSAATSPWPHTSTPSFPRRREPHLLLCGHLAMAQHHNPVVPAEAGTSPSTLRPPRHGPTPQPRRSRGGGNLTFYSAATSPWPHTSTPSFPRRREPPPLPKVAVKIPPPWVALLNQSELPRTVPFLQSLLPCDGTRHGVVHFKPDEPVYVVMGCMPWSEALLVLPYPLQEVGGDTDV